jgi:hypothetical protein
VTFLSFQRQLQHRAGSKLKVSINDNRSTMLSVKWESDCTKVSLHRMFLKAPHNVMEELACYLRRESKIIAPSVKAFIADNLKKYDYSHLLNRRKMHTQGSVYNLQKIYDDLNREYFGEKLDLSITWFGKPHQRHRRRVTFGLYHDTLRLIKIHRMMDSPAYPDYLVSFVIYHEMLHHVCPAYVDEKGLHRVHSKKFKEREKLFRYFDLAQHWIREHQGYFFD